MSENIPKAGESLPPSYNAAMGQPEVQPTPQANPQERLILILTKSPVFCLGILGFQNWEPW